MEHKTVPIICRNSKHKLMYNDKDVCKFLLQNQTHP